MHNPDMTASAASPTSCTPLAALSPQPCHQATGSSARRLQGDTTVMSEIKTSHSSQPLTAYTDEHDLSGPSPTHAYAAAPPLEKSILDRTNIPLCPYSDSTDILR